MILEEEVQIVIRWEKSRESKFALDNSQKNVDVLIPLARSLGKGQITPESLDAAVELTLHSLSFMPGYEPAVIKQQRQKAVADQAQLLADKERLEKIEKENRIRNKQLSGITKSPLLRAKEEMAQARAEYEAKAKAEYDDINGESFQKRQKTAKIEFERIYNDYTKGHSSGRINHPLTQERREGLRGIRVVSNVKDAKGNEVVLYDKMLELALEALRAFDREDQKMGY